MLIVDLMRTVAAGVPAHVGRDHMDLVVREYMATYRSADVDARAALLADEVRFEDPVGNVVGTSKDSAVAFFRATLDLGFSMDLRPVRVISVGNDALAITKLSLRRDDLDAADLDLLIRFVFDADGLITAVQTFFDESCITDAATASDT